MRTVVARIGRVRLKDHPGVSVISQQPGTAAYNHLVDTVAHVSRYHRADMAGYALVHWDSGTAFWPAYHTSISPIGGTAMCAFVHDALLRDWIERQR